MDNDTRVRSREKKEIEIAVIKGMAHGQLWKRCTRGDKHCQIRLN